MDVNSDEVKTYLKINRNHNQLSMCGQTYVLRYELHIESETPSSWKKTAICVETKSDYSTFLYTFRILPKDFEKLVFCINK